MKAEKNNSDLLSCPCCYSKTITARGEYEICNVCGWEDDPTQLADPAYAGGANKISLSQAQKNWLDQMKDRQG
jgi:hypothetical protein